MPSPRSTRGAPRRRRGGPSDAAMPVPDRARAAAREVFKRRTPLCPPFARGEKRPDAADFSPPCEGGVGGVKAAGHAMHLKAALGRAIHVFLTERARLAGSSSHEETGQGYSRLLQLSSWQRRQGQVPEERRAGPSAPDRGRAPGARD